MTARQHHDCAVAFCIDRNYLPLVLFEIWQIARLHPDRRFDFVISSQDELELPDWTLPYGIVLHVADDLPPEAEAARYRGSMSTLYRLLLARELGDRYRRIIYLDSDLFVEGGDLDRLMEIDLGPYPLAAALDVFFFDTAGWHPIEYLRAGLPPLPYFNSGVQVIDTQAFREQEVERRSLAVCVSHPHVIEFGDQSLLNMALQGKFAQLHPWWNWQISHFHPILTLTQPVFIHHFIGREKPHNSSNERWPARFNMAYRDFFGRYFPKALTELAPLPDLAPLSFRQAAKMVIDHTIAVPIFNLRVAGFNDPYRALL